MYDFGQWIDVLQKDMPEFKYLFSRRMQVVYVDGVWYGSEQEVCAVLSCIILIVFIARRTS